MTAEIGTAGIYAASWQMSTSENGGGGSTVNYVMNINATPIVKTTAQRKYATNDVGSCSSSGILTIADNDVIWLSSQSSGTNDLTHAYGNFEMHRL